MNGKNAGAAESPFTVDSIERWIVEKVAELAEVPVSAVSAGANISTFHLDSVGLAGLHYDLEDWCGLKIDYRGWVDGSIHEVAAKIHLLLSPKKP